MIHISNFTDILEVVTVNYFLVHMHGQPGAGDFLQTNY